MAEIKPAEISGILRQQLAGFKTEPAFGKLLKLNDPYQELCDLNKLSDLDLLNKFAP